MSLIDLINKNTKVATATVATHATDNQENDSTVAKLSDIEKIQGWLYQIGEPEEEHHIVLDKCKNDPEVLEYFLKHARGEFK